MDGDCVGAARSYRGHHWNRHESIGGDGDAAQAVGCVGSGGGRNQCERVAADSVAKKVTTTGFAAIYDEDSQIDAVGLTV